MKYLLMCCLLCLSFVTKGHTDNKTYLLTATTFLPFSADFKPLFHQIGQSFKTGKATQKERLKIALPGTTQWTMITDTEVDHLATRQFLPANETPRQWTYLLRKKQRPYRLILSANGARSSVAAK